MNNFLKNLALLLIIFSSVKLNAQEIFGNSKLSGIFQSDFQYYNVDTIIGAPIIPEKFRINSFLNLQYSSNNINAGLRYESYLNELNGFDPRYKGNGVANKYVSFKNDQLEATVGNFYEQFGSGMVLRSYWEPNLGYDNAFEGVSIKFKPHSSLQLKGLVAKQRAFFTTGAGIVRGLDAELDLNQVFTKLDSINTNIRIGGNFVSKYQKDEDPSLNLPENVGAYSLRLQLIHKGITFFTEYSYKINDPSNDNRFKYNNGNAFIAQLSYSQKGLGISLSAKRIDNMSFRSDRTASLNNLFINYIPAFTKQHTYNLLATLYPYASQPNGEWAGQAEIIYSIKKGSVLGGKYGTSIAFNSGAAYGLDTFAVDEFRYKSSMSKIGKLYFSDINLEISRKVSSKTKMAFTYANIAYNIDVVQGLRGRGTVFADVFILETNHRFNAKHALKHEIQALFTKQDNGNWLTNLLEYSVSPSYFIAVLNQWNVVDYKSISKKEITIDKAGVATLYRRLNYPIISVGYVKNANRIAVNYGRQRAGIFCVGGVCRNVPASNGLSVSVSSTF